jgi:hypothetical protein
LNLIFEIKNSYELIGNTVKFVVKVSGFGSLKNKLDTEYEVINLFGRAKYSDGYLIVEENSFKSHPDFSLKRNLTKEELDYIEILLNNSSVWEKVVRKKGKK